MQKKTLSIRADVELLEEIEQIAEREDRSLNQQILRFVKIGLGVERDRLMNTYPTLVK